MNNSLKIAIVGCGMISDTHVQEIRKIPGTNIVAVCDQERLMAEQLADRYHIPQYYSRLDEMLGDCHPDVLHILTTPPTHLPLSLIALEAGCHVLVEKPFTINVEEAIRVIEKAKSMKRKITVNHFHSFSAPSLRLRKIVHRGLLGDIVHIESHYGYSLNSPVALTLLKDNSSWVYRLPGKLLQNNISHLLSKITEYMPGDNPNVLAYALCLNNELRNINNSYVHDELRVLIAGKKTSAYATFSANVNPHQHFMRIHGTKSSLSVDYESRTIIYNYASKIPGSPGKLLPPFHYAKQYFLEGSRNLIKFLKSDFHFYSGMNKLLSLFYDCIKNDSEGPIPYKDIIKVSRIMDEIIQQINR